MLSCSLNSQNQCKRTEKRVALYCNIRDLKQTDKAAVNKQISIQKDSVPSEFSRPLTSITLKLNGDLNVAVSTQPPC